jgi:hypothetical protein
MAFPPPRFSTCVQANGLGVSTLQIPTVVQNEDEKASVRFSVLNGADWVGTQAQALFPSLIGNTVGFITPKNEKTLLLGKCAEKIGSQCGRVGKYRSQRIGQVITGWRSALSA